MVKAKLRKRAPRRLGPAWLALALLLLGIAAGARAEEPRFFRIATASTTGSYFQVGGVIASAISNPPGSPECQRGAPCGVPGLVAVAQATQGSVENIQALRSAQVESGFVQADVAHWAWAGEALYKGRPFKGLRAIAALFPESVHIVVAKDGPKSLAELKGRRVALGERESGTLADARLVLEAAGLKETEVGPEYLRLPQAAGGLGDQIDAFFLVAGWPVPGIAELAAAKPIRLLPIPDEVADKLRAQYKFFNRSSIPREAYEGLQEATPTVDMRALWVTTEDLPEALVYNITKTLWAENTKRLLETRHALGKRIKLDEALLSIDIPLHPGAERFYREAGLAIDTPAPTP